MKAADAGSEMHPSLIVETVMRLLLVAEGASEGAGARKEWQAGGVEGGRRATLGEDVFRSSWRLKESLLQPPPLPLPSLLPPLPPPLPPPPHRFVMDIPAVEEEAART